MARGYLRWSAKELADKAGVAESTIKRMEQGEGFPIARGANIEAVYKALVDAGIIFVPENGWRRRGTTPQAPDDSRRAN